MKEEIFDQQPMPPETREEQADHAAPVLPETPSIPSGAPPPVSQAVKQGRMPRWLLVTLVGMLVLAVLAGGTGVLVSLLHGQANAPARLALSTCIEGGLSARCGTLRVAENPSESGGRTISLHVVVLPATTSNREPDPLFYLEGGPGGAGTGETAWAAQHFGVFNQRHDIVLIDQRGTGESNQVACSTEGATIYSEAEVASLVRSCLASIKDKANPIYYTTPLSADDVDQVKAALGYDKIDLYGISYGVSLGLAYLQRHGAHVRAAVFDSGSLLNYHLWEQVPRSAQQALTMLFERCRSDASCHAAFPSVEADFASVTSRLAREPLETALVDPNRGSFFRLDLPTFLGLVIDGYLASPEGVATFPRDMHAAARGDWTAILQQLKNGLAPTSSVLMMRQTIICSDEWASLDPARVAAVAPGSPFTSFEVQNATTQATLCKYWPQAVGAVGRVQSRAPIVFLNAASDPVDPPTNVAGAENDMPNSLVVPVTGAGHWQLNYDPTGCLAAEANTFLELGAPSSPQSWPCAKSVPLPNFVV